MDDAVPHAAPPGHIGSRPERDALGAGVRCDGGWGRVVMVTYAAVLVAAVVVLAVADRLA
ncbi:rhamnulose-1-phosphate aldolase [Streptomyces azureus]|uniref:Rhamnulose-1-phosphate aldolase n=1 Tax=Streptomyces azureus TaxID=146537 RepID=A0A0K8PPA9_STRAJ|nr:rhamnulose-1-phosphate aldolase [Streptomyces azureus]